MYRKSEMKKYIKGKNEIRKAKIDKKNGKDVCIEMKNGMEN